MSASMKKNRLIQIYTVSDFVLRQPSDLVPHQWIHHEIDLFLLIVT